MQLFYNPQLKKDTSTFTFDQTESKHIIKVLRKKIGDELQITNGNGFFFYAIITHTDTKKCTADILKVKKVHPKRHRLHLAVAPTKMNDRFEWFLEKATEVGVHEITPILCDRSERKVVKLERFQKVVQSAMKQSFQAFLPKINEAISLKDFLQKPNDGLLFIAHCERSERFELKRRVAPDKNITILIGPEGDFSLTEIEKAKENGYVPVIMGQNRLRTETAAIVACTTVSIVNNG